MKPYKVIFLLIFMPIILYSEKNPEVGIVEKLGQKIPLELSFTNSEGKQVKLSEIINKPTILSFVYFHCPGICSPLTIGLSEVVDKTDLQPGKDYQLITISMDPGETYDKAKTWRDNHIGGLDKKIPYDAWQFLVGDTQSVKKITDAIGFYYKYDGKKDFIHAGAIYAIAPDGKIIRYLFGTEFNPFDFKMAILEASKGTPMPTVNKLLEYCYSYDPEGRSYVFNFTKVIGTLMLLILGIFFAFLVITSRKRNKKGVQNG